MPVELHRDVCAEAAAGHGDGIVPFLFGADPDAPVAGDAQIIVPQDKGIRVVGTRASRGGSLESGQVRFQFGDGLLQLL